tara:strand:+ start:1215 stop:1460 length:246 start_codon:yes stop_codon:yes gene_type:complete
MIALNEILIRKISKNDLPKVIDLLQEISVYNPPPKKYEGIWERYSEQQHVIGYCFFLQSTTYWIRIYKLGDEIKKRINGLL